ncbi:MAG: hypothetical protein NDF54_09310 [archaeon GB-1867-035]|nr:hypothetical protein [Candidatus Culexmicrobium profundum]
MSKGQLLSFEAFVSLLIVLVFSFLAVNLYNTFPRDDLKYEDFELSLSYALLKMDETGFLDKIALESNWKMLYSLIVEFLPNCKVRLEVYDQKLSIIYLKGHCNRVSKIVCYVFVSNQLSTIYGIKVYIGE